MAAPAFRFKRFDIYQNRCAMKVSTDGLLLGTWTDLADAKRILDIGTGTGLLALLAADRAPKAVVDAIEFDDSAAKQASENVARSLFCDRVTVHRADVRKISSANKYDHIICNPPYYRGERPASADLKNVAKHGSTLSFTELLEVVYGMLAVKGQFSVILPANRWDEFVQMAHRRGLLVHRVAEVCYKHDGPVKRMLACFGRPRVEEVRVDRIAVRRNGVIDEKYAAMLAPFIDDPRV